MGAIFGQLLLVLRHLLQHCTQIFHCGLVTRIASSVYTLVSRELFEHLGDLLGDFGYVLVSQLHPTVVILIQPYLLSVVISTAGGGFVPAAKHSTSYETDSSRNQVKTSSPRHKSRRLPSPTVINDLTQL